jgi:GNAT superfamily N-acetyltransferase
MGVDGSDAGQSTKDHPDLDDWFENFLMLSLRKCWAVLNSGGHMVVIINNVRGGADFVMRMVENVCLFERADYIGVISYADKRTDGGYKSPQPMWVWKKDDDTIAPAVLSPAELQSPPNVSVVKFAREHLDGLLAVTSDPIVMHTVAAGHIWDKERLLKLLSYKNSPLYTHNVIKDGDTIVGYIGVYPMNDIPGAQIRIFLAQGAQGHGIALAAVRAIIATTKVNLYMQMRPDNAASIRLAQRAGFREVRGNFWIGETRLLRYVYEVLGSHDASTHASREVMAHAMRVPDEEITYQSVRGISDVQYYLSRLDNEIII